MEAPSFLAKENCFISVFYLDHGNFVTLHGGHIFDFEQLYLGYS
jgi:hypothetical protein